MQVPYEKLKQMKKDNKQLTYEQEKLLSDVQRAFKLYNIYQEFFYTGSSNQEEFGKWVERKGGITKQILGAMSVLIGGLAEDTAKASGSYGPLMQGYQEAVNEMFTNPQKLEAFLSTPINIESQQHYFDDLTRSTGVPYKETVTLAEYIVQNEQSIREIAGSWYRSYAKAAPNRFKNREYLLNALEKAEKGGPVNKQTLTELVKLNLSLATDEFSAAVTQIIQQSQQKVTTPQPTPTVQAAIKAAKSPYGVVPTLEEARKPIAKAKSQPELRTAIKSATSQYGRIPTAEEASKNVEEAKAKSQAELAKTAIKSAKSQYGRIPTVEEASKTVEEAKAKSQAELAKTAIKSAKSQYGRIPTTEEASKAVEEAKAKSQAESPKTAVKPTPYGPLLTEAEAREIAKETKAKSGLDVVIPSPMERKTLEAEKKSKSLPELRTTSKTAEEAKTKSTYDVVIPSPADRRKAQEGGKMPSAEDKAAELREVFKARHRMPAIGRKQPTTTTTTTTTTTKPSDYGKLPSLEKTGPKTPTPVATPRSVEPEYQQLPIVPGKEEPTTTTTTTTTTKPSDYGELPRFEKTGQKTPAPVATPRSVGAEYQQLPIVPAQNPFVGVLNSSIAAIKDASERMQEFSEKSGYGNAAECFKNLKDYLSGLKMTSTDKPDFLQNFKEQILFTYNDIIKNKKHYDSSIFNSLMTTLNTIVASIHSTEGMDVTKEPNKQKRGLLESLKIAYDSAKISPADIYLPQIFKVMEDVKSLDTNNKESVGKLKTDLTELQKMSKPALGFLGSKSETYKRAEDCLKQLDAIIEEQSQYRPG